VEEVEEDDVDCVNEVDILEEVSGSRSSVVEDIEAIVDLEEVVVWTMDMVVNWSCAERVVVSVVTEDDVELELDVLTSGNTELGTLEKAAELVWNVDELDTVAKGSKESVENDVEVEEEKEDDAVDEIFDCIKELVDIELEENLSIAGANASSAVGLAAVTLLDEEKDVYIV
jgi:hypothetical protein